MAVSDNLVRIQATILGTLLKDSRQMGEVAAELSPEDFGTGTTRDIFEAMCRLHFAGAPVEETTLIHELGDDYAVAIAEILKCSTMELKYYCKMLKEQSRLEDAKAEALNIAYAESLSQAEDSLERLNGFFADKRELKIVSAPDAASSFFDRVSADTIPEYLPWGMSRLNTMLYAERGDFVVIGGYPSAGKTLLSIQFAIAMATKYRVGFFSLETSPAKLTDRIMSHLAHVPLSKIKSRDLGDSDWLALARAGERLHTLPIDLIDAGGMTVRDIKAVCLNRRYQIIFVDYLQLVNAKGKDRYEQVTSISQGLHTLARAHNIAVVALAQLSRPEKKGDKLKPPSMSSFKESGQIEQDAEIALLLYPSDPYDNRSNRILKIAKNKDGKMDKVELEFNGAVQTMTQTNGEDYKAVAAATQAGKAGAIKKGRPNSSPAQQDDPGDSPYSSPGNLCDSQVSFHELPADEPLPF